MVLNEYGKSLNALFPTVAAGEYFRSQEKIKNEQSNQSKALVELKKRGVDAATALKMLEDPILAAAIANNEIKPELFAQLAQETSFLMELCCLPPC